MKTVFRNVLCVASAIGFFSGAAYAGNMSGPDIKKAVVGKTLSSKTRSGKPFTVVFKSSGSGTMSIKGIGNFAAKWHIDADHFCWQVPKFGEPEECDVVCAAGKGLKFVDAKSGKTNNVYKILN